MRISAAPAGAQSNFPLYPGLTPWANGTTAASRLDYRGPFHRATPSRILTMLGSRSILPYFTYGFNLKGLSRGTFSCLKSASFLVATIRP
jgi:hypothetical protein